ncbi:hypothetical protein K438DRAFT_1797644 [Mycena galopus ATCC 62051]|nr:hypothetical protein K438DRAFT_1797644 [Mycena galopus ATCC 62051]
MSRRVLATMSEFNCHICFSDYPIDSFRVLGTCGHCFCVSCISAVQRTKPVCPECRAPISPSGPQQIYLDPAKPLARVLAEGIGRMDSDAKPVSVRTAQRKLRQIVKEREEREEATGELLAALADFSERIVPLFVKARSQAAEIGTLKKQQEGMDEVRAQADRAMALSGEVSMLRAEQRTLREEVRDANTRCDRERARVEASETQVRRAEAAEKEAQSEVRRLKGLLERAAEDRNVQKNKMKAVMRENEGFEQQLEQLKGEMQGANPMYCDDLEIEEEAVYLDEEYSAQPSPHRTWSSRPPPSLTFEGMPRPGFGSDWELGRGIKRKEKERDAGFPIALSHGRTTTVVQLGPKLSRRVKARI